MSRRRRTWTARLAAGRASISGDDSRAPPPRAPDPGPRTHRALLSGRPRAQARVPTRGDDLPRDARGPRPPELRPEPARVRPRRRRPRPLRPALPARRVEEGLRAGEARRRADHGPARAVRDLHRRPERLYRRALLRLIPARAG